VCGVLLAGVVFRRFVAGFGVLLVEDEARFGVGRLCGFGSYFGVGGILWMLGRTVDIIVSHSESVVHLSFYYAIHQLCHDILCFHRNVANSFVMPSTRSCPALGRLTMRAVAGTCQNTSLVYCHHFRSKTSQRRGTTTTTKA
jgi:hypothetical protein